jgi:hypothetical protein
MVDPIRPAGDFQAAKTPPSSNSVPTSSEADRQFAKLEPMQKWVRGEWLLVEVKFTVRGGRKLHKAHEFAPSLEGVVRRYEELWSGERALVSVAQVHALKAAGVIHPPHPLRSLRSHAQYFAHVFVKPSAKEAKVRLQSAYSCLRHGVAA